MKFIFLYSLLSGMAFANISIIIPHNKVINDVTEKELSNLFLKKTNTIRGIKITPIDSKNKGIYEEFYKKVIKKTPTQIREYWINQIYMGNKQPPKKLSNNEIKKAMKEGDCIITYASNPLNGKLIFTIK